MFDFWTQQPESVHQVTILMSDRGIPVNPMHMNGYGSHTYSFWNGGGQSYWVKVGEIELNRNVDNYFQQVENAAYSPSNIVPGISFSPDKMLQARIFAYADAHRYRLGTHYEALPVNCPKSGTHHYHKDGAMRFFTNDFGNADAYYEPNTKGGAIESPAAKEPPLRIDGNADRFQVQESEHDYLQPRKLFELFDEAQRRRLYFNYAAAMGPVSDEIREKWCAILDRVHPDYGSGVRKALAETDSDVNAVPITADTAVQAK